MSIVLKKPGFSRSDAPNEAARAPETIILRPSRGWTALNLHDIWEYRDLLLSLATRDVKLRYRQTALGVIWVVLQPLIAAFLFALVFGQVAKLPSDGLPYFLFAFAGLLGWNAFNTTLTKIAGCLVGNAQLVSKIYFPRLVLPLSTLFSALIDFGVALALLAVLLVVYHVTPGWGLLLLPVWLALLLLLAVGLGLVTAALTVTYRDVQFILPVLMQFALYATPVAYALSAAPARLRPFFELNPLAVLIGAFRWSLLGVAPPAAGPLALSAALSVGAFLWGAQVFRTMERRFADVI